MTLFKSPTINYKSTSLNGAINSSVQTITLNSTTNLQYPGYIVINREGSTGTATPDFREVVSYTGIDGQDLTGCTRGADNSTARSHADGALVEPIMTAGMWDGLTTSFLVEHATAGTHAIIANATITTVNINALRGVSASITTLNANKLTSLVEPAGVGGQFYWARSGALATSSPSVAGDTHFPLQRTTKELTINSFYGSLMSAPSTAAFQCDISYGSLPTGNFASIFSTVPTIDVGEHDTTTAATAAVLGLTSLASGVLMRFEVDASGDAGDLGALLKVTSR